MVYLLLKGETMPRFTFEDDQIYMDDMRYEFEHLTDELNEYKEELKIRLTKERIKSGEYKTESQPGLKSLVKKVTMEEGKIIVEDVEESIVEDDVPIDSSIDLSDWDFAGDPDCPLNEEELTLLEDLISLDKQISFKGSYLISSSAIDDYIKEEIQESTTLPRGTSWDDFPFNYIDWDSAIESVKDDYDSVRISSSGETYYYNPNM
jgi:hypothetical protein